MHHAVAVCGAAEARATESSGLACLPRSAWRRQAGFGLASAAEGGWRMEDGGGKKEESGKRTEDGGWRNADFAPHSSVLIPQSSFFTPLSFLRLCFLGAGDEHGREFVGLPTQCRHGLCLADFRVG